MPKNTENQPPGYLSDDDFAWALQHLPMATFDLLINVPGHGIVLLWRTIEPYQDVWALPGLRMRFGQTRLDTMQRVATAETGLPINPTTLKIVGQYDGLFDTRQDISTGYLAEFVNPPAALDEIPYNREHFSDVMFVNSAAEIPEPIGEMYRYYLEQYFAE